MYGSAFSWELKKTLYMSPEHCLCAPLFSPVFCPINCSHIRPLESEVCLHSSGKLLGFSLILPAFFFFCDLKTFSSSSRNHYICCTFCRNHIWKPLLQIFIPIFSILEKFLVGKLSGKRWLEYWNGKPGKKL